MKIHVIDGWRVLLLALVLAAAGLVVNTPAAHAVMPNFQIPFPCGETWHASTYSNHGAIDWNDYPDDDGHPVLASAAGTASIAYQEGGWGYYVLITHADGWQTRYAHLQQNGRVSGSVSQGQVIGYVGNSGDSSSPHLHWEQILNGTRQNTLYANGAAVSPGTAYNASDPAYTSGNCAAASGNNQSKVHTLAGNYSGSAADDFAYVTKRSDGGTDIAIFESTPTGIVWKGLWFSAGNVSYDTSVFMPMDSDNDGDLDLLYATHRSNGFDLALATNTGSGFSYVGQQWNPNSLLLSTTKFIPGDWSGGPADDFAYMTPTSTGGFDLAVFESTPTGIVWKGNWLHEPNLSFNTTRLFPIDNDDDGDDDLFYATPRAGGFDLALDRNTGSGFIWAGHHWNPDLDLSTTRFIPGDFTGSAADDFAYVTPRGDGGFDLAVFESTPTGIVWKGHFWNAPGQTETTFVPADFDGDGDLDLFYVTPRQSTGYFDMALVQNTGTSYGYVGQQWNPNLPQSITKFLPQH